MGPADGRTSPLVREQISSPGSRQPASRLVAEGGSPSTQSLSQAGTEVWHPGP